MRKTPAYLIFTLLGLALMATGCQQNPEKHAQQAEAEPLQLNANEFKIPASAIRLGNEITLPAGVDAEARKMKIRKIYFSALGQQCLRLEDNQSKESVVCERTAGIYKNYPLLVK